MSKPSRLAFDDYELQKQYELEFGINSAYEPKVVQDLWYCTCGVLNCKEESNCHHCRNSLADLQKIDINAMKQRRDERIAKEQKEASAAKKKALQIGIPLAAAIIVFLLITKVILPSINYNKATALLEQGNYAEAAAMFEKLGNFKNASEMILEVAYQEAASLMDAGNFKDAIPIFRSLNAYKDSASKLSTCQNTVDYEKAMNAFTDKDYTTAAPLFKRLGEYQDSKKKLEACYIAIHGEDVYKKISSLKVGDQVELGRFEQDNRSKTTDEPIVWNVIAADNDAFLLLSDEILTYMRYHDEYTVGNHFSWEQSSNFEWLNLSFYVSAFNKEERSVILLNNPSCTANVFLLSSEEAANLPRSIREAQSTKYAISRSSTKVTRGYWALRTIIDIESPIIGGKHYLTVNKYGDPPIGFRVREEQNEYEIVKHGLNCGNTSDTGIRPAVWVSLDAYK